MSDAILKVTLRNSLTGNFKDKESGDLIEYRQIQGEHIDPVSGQIDIKRISVSKGDWSVLDTLKKLEGQTVLIEVDQSTNKNMVKNRLASREIIPVSQTEIKKAS